MRRRMRRKRRIKKNRMPKSYGKRASASPPTVANLSKISSCTGFPAEARTELFADPAFQQELLTAAEKSPRLYAQTFKEVADYPECPAAFKQKLMQGFMARTLTADETKAYLNDPALRETAVMALNQPEKMAELYQRAEKIPGLKPLLDQSITPKNFMAAMDHAAQHHAPESFKALAEAAANDAGRFNKQQIAHMVELAKSAGMQEAFISKLTQRYTAASGARDYGFEMQAGIPLSSGDLATAMAQEAQAHQQGKPSQFDAFAQAALARKDITPEQYATMAQSAHDAGSREFRQEFAKQYFEHGGEALKQPALDHTMAEYRSSKPAAVPHVPPEHLSPPSSSGEAYSTIIPGLTFSRLQSIGNYISSSFNALFHAPTVHAPTSVPHTETHATTTAHPEALPHEQTGHAAGVGAAIGFSAASSNFQLYRETGNTDYLWAAAGGVVSGASAFLHGKTGGALGFASDGAGIIIAAHNGQEGQLGGATGGLLGGGTALFATGALSTTLAEAGTVLAPGVGTLIGAVAGGVLGTAGHDFGRPAGLMMGDKPEEQKLGKEGMWLTVKEYAGYIINPNRIEASLNKGTGDMIGAIGSGMNSYSAMVDDAKASVDQSLTESTKGSWLSIPAKAVSAGFAAVADTFGGGMVAKVVGFIGTPVGGFISQRGSEMKEQNNRVESAVSGMFGVDKPFFQVDREQAAWDAKVAAYEKQDMKAKAAKEAQKTAEDYKDHPDMKLAVNKLNNLHKGESTYAGAKPQPTSQIQV